MKDVHPEIERERGMYLYIIISLLSLRYDSQKKKLNYWRQL